MNTNPISGHASEKAYEDTSNWLIIGHEWAVKSLQQHVSKGIQRQSYLITGPENVGRRTLAIRFAQAVNCLNPPTAGIPCLNCRTCGQFERFVHPDLAVVEAEGIGGQIKIDQIRDLQHGLYLAPYDARFRIALLLRFEEANDHTANALLKTLEEPPENAIIFLTAESAERLLPTIVSRCEVIPLRPVPPDTLNQGLRTQWLIPEDEAALLTHLSEGRPGYGLRLYQQPEILAQRKAWLDEMEDLLTLGRVQRFAYAGKLPRNRSDVRQLLKVWLGFWRDIMLRSLNSNSQVINIDYQESIDRLAIELDQEKIFQVVTAIDESFDQLDHFVNSRLAVEDLMLILPFNHDLTR